MTEKKQKEKRRISAKLNLNSQFWKTFLIVLAALLTFAGPTYAVLVFMKIFEINYTFSMISGFALFIAGLLLILYLIKKKVIS